MIQTPQFTWIDVTNPSKEDEKTLSSEFDLPIEQVMDCLTPGHLPKYEEAGKHQFIILRSFEPEADKKSDSIETLTRKLAIFYHDGFILSFHHKPHPYLDAIYEKYSRAENLTLKHTIKAVAELFLGVAKSFEPGVIEAYKKFYDFEQDVFAQDRKVRLSTSYLLKRRASIMKRMMRMNLISMNESIDNSNAEITSAFANAMDYIDKLFFQLDEIHDGVTSLLNLQVTLASQKTNEASHKTNEVMRVLTIISVFIMPMNFIASVYGMNFSHMPELHWEFGYPFAIGLMISVAVIVYLWFRKKAG